MEDLKGEKIVFDHEMKYIDLLPDNLQQFEVSIKILL